MKEWYLQVDGQESGPFSRDELVFLAKEGRLSLDDQVRRGASGQWRPAGQEFGPFSGDELVFLAKEGRLSPDDQVRRGASGQWRPAESVLKKLRRPVQQHKRPPAVEPSPTSNDTP